MRIDVEKPPELPFQSTLVYGASRAGKTDYCASYPQPAMLCSRREKGYVTVQFMDRARWYDPKVAPQVYAVDEITDIMGHLTKDILPQVAAGRIKTVCIELTFHADDVLRAVDDEKNPWAKYAQLETHVHNLDRYVKKVPGARVVYNTLALPEDAAKGTSGCLIPGKALAKKLPALCDLSGYLVAEDRGDHVDRVLHLTTYGNYPAGHRYGKHLPDKVRNPCYRDLEDLLAGRAKVDEDGNVVREAPKTIGLPPLGKK